MNQIEILIKEAYRRLRSKKSFGEPSTPASEEDIACCASGLMSEREKEKILDDVILRSGDEKALKHSFLLTTDITERAEEVPESLVAKAKQLLPQPMEGNALDAVVEFAGNIARVIRTTGTILTSTLEGKAIPAVAYRGPEAQLERKAVEISKAVNSHIIDVRIVKIKEDLVNLTVHIRNKRTGKPSSGERVSLTYQGRELRSSLTDMGKVEFENIKLRDYHINLIRKGEPFCVAMLSLRALEG